MKIIIHATIKVDPEKRQGLIDLLRPHIAAVQDQIGCVNYTCAAEGRISEHINVYEEWTDEMSLKSHFNGDNFAKIGQSLNTYGILGAIAKKYRVDKEAPVFNSAGSASIDFD